MGELLSVNVAEIREIPRRGRMVRTGIWKFPAPGRLAVRGVNVDGDEQADRTVHGGYDKAVYAYAREDYDWWEAELGRELGPGTFGENLTVSGVDVSSALVGERWRIADVVLEVSEPRLPCWKLGYKMGDPRFLKRFAQALRPGAYLRVIDEGTLGAGDPINVIERPGHEVTMRSMVEAHLGEPALSATLLAAPALSDGWRQWAEDRVARAAA
jgi:MOSC domain-containing protein YiiM